MRTPPRRYVIRRGTFRLTTSGRGTMLWCARCCKDVACEVFDREGVFPDVGPMAEVCRQHEIGHHSATVSWRCFRRGWALEATDPAYLRSLTAGNAAALHPGTLPKVRRRVAYEWLAEDEAPRPFGLPPAAVVVREPESLTAWLGPERAVSELAAA